MFETLNEFPVPFFISYQHQLLILLFVLTVSIDIADKHVVYSSVSREKPVVLTIELGRTETTALKKERSFQSEMSCDEANGHERELEKTKNEGDKDLLGEIFVSANNQGKSIPRKRDYRQRAHCNPLSIGKYAGTPLRPFLFDPFEHYEKQFLRRLREETNSDELDDDCRRITICDVGCGFGGLLVRLSPLFPQELMIGMEIRAQVSEYVRERCLALRKEYPGEYQNISGLRTNSMKFLPNYFVKAQLTKIFFLFPDPHFKRSKRRRRIIQTALIAEYAFCLREGGRLYTQTDVEDVGDWMKEKLDLHPLFRAMTEDELANDICCELLRRGTPTEESQKVKRNNGNTWLHCYVRIANPQY